MSVTVVLNGVNYDIPVTGDSPPTVNWGPQLTAYLTALATAYGNTAPGFFDYTPVVSSPITGVSGKTYAVDTTSARTINLPAPAINAYIVVKDITGGAESNNITIVQNGSEDIDGSASNKTLALAYGTWTILSDGTDWFSIMDNTKFATLADAQTIAGAKTFSALLTASAGILSVDLDLGSSGTAGSLDIFPTTASKGKIRITAADSSDDYTLDIVNAALGAARTYTIPEVSGDADFVMTAGTQSIAGAKTLSGLLTASAGIATTDGDFGSSGTAGSVDIFPGTASKGKISITAADSADDYTLTIVNASLAAARTYTIPDAGAAASFVMTAGAQIIAGIKTFSAAIYAADGAEATPSITFASDPNNGLSLPNTDTVALSCNSVIVMQWHQTAVNFNFSGSLKYQALTASFNAAGEGAQDLGTATNYWGDVNYKTLTDRGCLPWCDEGVELMDGAIVTDMEAICQIGKHPTKKTVHGLPMLNYKSFPKKSYRAADEDGVTIDRDENDEPVVGSDGVEMTMMFGVMIGAFKEAEKRISALEKR
jgi:hypothetical protein